MAEQDEMDWLHPDAPPSTVQVATDTMARHVNAQEARDFGISTDRVCLQTEHVFCDADDDVLRHTITVDYSGQPHVTRHVPTAEELVRRE
ncbi:hypothetical protein ACFYXC_36635 [Streptomyces sp. NPDC002701]|uniref:hypothetical protein n=1 Tax=Streptomyces sp. NPDC002701 TaxID=3364661 RepID=UPI0036C5ED36